MPNSASAQKRVRQDDNRRSRNRVRKSRVKTAIKNLQECIQHGKKEEAMKQQSSVQKIIDQATASGIYKKNMAARMKSKIMRDINGLS